MAAVALFHDLEEDVALLGTEVEVAHFVDHEQIEAGKALDHGAGGAVGEAGVHVVKEVLSLDEPSPVAGLQSTGE